MPALVNVTRYFTDERIGNSPYMISKALEKNSSFIAKPS